MAGRIERRDRKNDVAMMSNLKPCLRRMRETARDVRRLHVAVAQLDAPERVADLLDAHAVFHLDARNVLGPHGQDHVLLVQHLVVLEVVQQSGGRRIGIARQEHGGSLDLMRRALFEHPHQLQEAARRSCGSSRTGCVVPLHPGPHHQDDHATARMTGT